jgi:hypothetical protein
MTIIRNTLTIFAGIGLLSGSAFAQAAAQTTTKTTVGSTATPANAATADVGISSRDGITFSGGDVLVTRNGVTEKLTKELGLPNGLRVQPDGTILTADGGKLTLRPTQILTFEGKLINAPIAESVTGSARTTETKTTTTTTGGAAVSGSTKSANPAAVDIANAEAERRAKAAGESAQKATGTDK